MYLQNTFELALTLDTGKFQKLLDTVYAHIEPAGDDEYVDSSMTSKGITVTYRDSRYKKKVKLIINPAWVLDDYNPDPDKLIRKLEKRIDSYFSSRYGLDDFALTGMVLSTDIDVGDHDKVSAYLKVLQRIGRVKGFSPPGSSWLGDDICFCLEGNSNGTEFMIFDLEGLLRKQLEKAEHERKQLKSIIEKPGGLLRTQVRLTELKAIRAYTD